MSRKLKAGVVGTGLIGKRHISGYKDMDEVEIVAVADIDKDEAQKVAKEYEIPNIFTDYHDLLKLDLDTVDVCLPNFLHSPVTIDALESGKHVYCEKPMARTGDEAQAMCDAAKRTGKHLAIQLGTLYRKETKAAKNIITEGKLGDVYYVKTSYYRRRGRVYVDGYATPHFVQKEKSGGGALADMAVYHMACMVWLLDNPDLDTVTGFTYQELPMDEKRRRESGYNVEELGIGLVHFKNNATMFVEESWAIHAPSGEGDRLYGNRGGLRLEPLTLFHDVDGEHTDTELDADELLGDYAAEGYGGSQKHFVWSVLGRVKPIDTAGIALKVAKITSALYDSAETERQVVFE
jgi:predicted dehydrogenase